MLIQFLLSISLTSTALAVTCLPDESSSPEQQQTEAPVIAELTTASEAIADAAVSEVTETPAPEEWTLRYKFLPDQTLRYKSKESVTLDAMKGEGRKVDVTGFEQRRLFTVTSVDDLGAARFTMQYEFVRMQVQTDAFDPIIFDTTMKPEEIPPSFRNTARQLQGSAPRFWISSLGTALQKSEQSPGGVPVSAAVAQAGNVTVAKKSSDTSDGGVEQAIATTDSPPGEATKAEKSSSSDSVTFLMPLPEASVAVGETWREIIPVSVRVTAEISRRINILRTFRLESVENGIATISFRSSVEASLKSPIIRSQLIKATPKGSLTFDVERGLMLTREIRYDEMVLNAIGADSVVLCNGSSTEILLEDTAE